MDQRIYWQPLWLLSFSSKQIYFQKPSLSRKEMMHTNARYWPDVAHMCPPHWGPPHMAGWMQPMYLSYTWKQQPYKIVCRHKCPSKVIESEISKSCSSQVGQWGGADSTWTGYKSSSALMWVLVSKLITSLCIKRKPLFLIVFFMLATSLSTYHHQVVGASMAQTWPSVVARGSKHKHFLSAHPTERNFPLSPPMPRI